MNRPDQTSSPFTEEERRGQEERLRKVIQAYDYLRKSGYCS